MSGYKKKSNITKPFLFVLYNFLFLLIIPVNYFLVCSRNEIPFLNIHEVLSAATVWDWLMVIPPVFFIPGISFLKKWGWILFTGYAPYSIVVNSYVSIMVPSDYNLGALGQALFSMISFAYFMQSDIRSVFFKSGFKGWRNSERHVFHLDVSVNGKMLKCVNLSPGGCAVDWPGCPLKVDMPVSVSFLLRKRKFFIKGRITRITPSFEIGISFVNLEAGTQKVLRELLEGFS